MIFPSKFTSDWFHNLKKVDVNSYKDFEPFRYGRLEHPVFWHSVTAMIGLGGFYWVVIQDCLIIFRVTRMYGNSSCIVYSAPVHARGNLEMEQFMFSSLIYSGFSVRLTQAEANLLNVNLKKAKKDTFYNEFIYSVKDSLAMEGHKYVGLRNMVKRFDKEGGVVRYGFLSISNITSLVSDWARVKKIRYGNYIDFLNNYRGGSVGWTALFLNDDIQGFSLVEFVGGFYILVMFICNPNAPFDMVPALNYYTLSGLPNKDTFINSGSGTSDGLGLQKRRLRPCKEEMVYRFPAFDNAKNGYKLVKEYL